MLQAPLSLTYACSFVHSCSGLCVCSDVGGVLICFLAELWMWVSWYCHGWYLFSVHLGSFLPQAKLLYLPPGQLTILTSYYSINGVELAITQVWGHPCRINEVFSFCTFCFTYFILLTQQSWRWWGYEAMMTDMSSLMLQDTCIIMYNSIRTCTCIRVQICILIMQASSRPGCM